jgi:hypothetical protein
MGVARAQAVNQPGNSLGLVARGLEVRDEFEVSHCIRPEQEFDSP